MHQQITEDCDKQIEEQVAAYEEGHFVDEEHKDLEV